LTWVLLAGYIRLMPCNIFPLCVMFAREVRNAGPTDRAARRGVARLGICAGRQELECPAVDDSCSWSRRSGRSWSPQHSCRTRLFPSSCPSSTVAEQHDGWSRRAAPQLVEEKFDDVVDDDQLCVATVVDPRFKLGPFDSATAL